MGWVVIDCEVLPDIKDRIRGCMYRTPDGLRWLPNTLTESEQASHWISQEEFLDHQEVGEEVE